LYAKDLWASLAPDSKRLIRFEKINLKPGETKTVSFTIDEQDLKFVGINNKWVVEEGEFELQIGGNPKALKIKPIYYKK
jgi:beta-glucosidase